MSSGNALDRLKCLVVDWWGQVKSAPVGNACVSFESCLTQVDVVRQALDDLRGEVRPVLMVDVQS